jgi:hypothetical protein
MKSYGTKLSVRDKKNTRCIVNNSMECTPIIPVSVIPKFTCPSSATSPNASYPKFSYPEIHLSQFFIIFSSSACRRLLSVMPAGGPARSSCQLCLLAPLPGALVIIFSLLFCVMVWLKFQLQFGGSYFHFGFWENIYLQFFSYVLPEVAEVLPLALPYWLLHNPIGRVYSAK